MRRKPFTAPVPNRVIKRVADTVGANEKTIRRVIDGKPVRPVTGTKVRRELERRGYPTNGEQNGQPQNT